MQKQTNKNTQYDSIHIKFKNQGFGSSGGRKGFWFWRNTVEFVSQP